MQTNKQLIRDFTPLCLCKFSKIPDMIFKLGYSVAVQSSSTFWTNLLSCFDTSLKCKNSIVWFIAEQFLWMIKELAVHTA